MSIAAIVIGTEADFMNKFIGTTGLTRAQWGACVVIPIGLIAASEAWKWYLRRRDQQAAPAESAAPAAAAETQPA
jgi:hypothetical protein